MTTAKSCKRASGEKKKVNQKSRVWWDERQETTATNKKQEKAERKYFCKQAIIWFGCSMKYWWLGNQWRRNLGKKKWQKERTKKKVWAEKWNSKLICNFKSVERNKTQSLTNNLFLFLLRALSLRFPFHLHVTNDEQLKAELFELFNFYRSRCALVSRDRVLGRWTMVAPAFVRNWENHKGRKGLIATFGGLRFCRAIESRTKITRKEIKFIESLFSMQLLRLP